jgi:hypothetical protein
VVVETNREIASCAGASEATATKFDLLLGYTVVTRANCGLVRATATAAGGRPLGCMYLQSTRFAFRRRWLHGPWIPHGREGVGRNSA